MTTTLFVLDVQPMKLVSLDGAPIIKKAPISFFFQKETNASIRGTTLVIPLEESAQMPITGLTDQPYLQWFRLMSQKCGSLREGHQASTIPGSLKLHRKYSLRPRRFFALFNYSLYRGLG
jgi:hypothetical protein